MLHQGPAQYAVVDVEQPLAVGATRCGETLGLIGKKDPIGIKKPLVAGLATKVFSKIPGTWEF